MHEAVNKWYLQEAEETPAERGSSSPLEEKKRVVTYLAAA
jgi:hypothetical protein